MEINARRRKSEAISHPTTREVNLRKKLLEVPTALSFARALYQRAWHVANAISLEDGGLMPLA
jgi:hypothetical protein